MRKLNAIRLVLLVTAALAVGCERRSEPKTESPPVVAKPEFFQEADDWPLKAALGFLESDDAETRLRGALRVIRLNAETTPVVTPEPLPLEMAEKIVVTRLGPESWALGVPSRERSQEIWGPVLIVGEGEVLQIDEEETTPVVLRLSEEPEFFPHIIVSHRAVYLGKDPRQAAFALASPDNVGFELRYSGGVPYVALTQDSATEDELARYVWDVYELVFKGPAADALPDGGVFELDQERCAALEAVGGRMPGVDVAPPPDDADVPSEPTDDEEQKKDDEGVFDLNGGAAI